MRYSFDDFEADSEAFTLCRGGTPVAISPLSLQLVVLLLERRGRLVAKEELFAELWPDRPVADAALATCLSGARRALGDDAKNPRYLITRHGKGVCFSPDIEVVVGDIVASREVRPQAAASAAPSWRRRWFSIAGLVGALGLVTGMWGLRAWRAPEVVEAGAVAFPDRGTILLVPLATATADAEIQLLSLAISDALARTLEREGWIVLGPTLARELASTATSVAELAAATGVETVVTGGLRESAAHQPPELVVEVHQAGGQPHRQLQVAVPRLENDASLDGLAMAVARVVAALGGARSDPPSSVELPGNVVAYRLYLRGLSWLEEPGCDAGARAELLEQSLGLDPNFPATSMLLARLHQHLGTNCLFGARHLEEALARAEAVANLDPGLLEPRVLAAALRYELGDLDGSRLAVDALRSAFPGRPGPACLALRLDVTVGREVDPAAVATCDRARGLSPRGTLPFALLFSGDYAHFLRRGSLDPTLRGHYLRAFAAFRLGREPEARVTLEPLFELSPAEVWGRLAHLLLAVIEGRGKDAGRIAEALATVREAAGLGDTEIDYHVGQLLVLVGEIEAARRQLDFARSRGFACGWCFERDPALERLRVVDRGVTVPSG